MISFSPPPSLWSPRGLLLPLGLFSHRGGMSGEGVWMKDNLPVPLSFFPTRSLGLAPRAEYANSPFFSFSSSSFFSPFSLALVCCATSNAASSCWTKLEGDVKQSWCGHRMPQGSWVWFLFPSPFPPLPCVFSFGLLDAIPIDELQL